MIQRQIILIFNSNITMNNINFRYSKDTPWVIKNVNLVIEKGSRVGFVGQTGCGKSTMLDILMGLLDSYQMVHYYLMAINLKQDLTTVDGRDISHMFLSLYIYLMELLRKISYSVQLIK